MEMCYVVVPTGGSTEKPEEKVVLGPFPDNGAAEAWIIGKFGSPGDTAYDYMQPEILRAACLEDF
ncbi:MAG: hypothetical protein ACYS7Y_11880 [Planctomycetota bacterium]